VVRHHSSKDSSPYWNRCDVECADAGRAGDLS
jgi:hypothetical protein